MTAYNSLLTPCSRQVADPAQPYQLLTERHLQAIWFEQKYFKNLVDATGASIEVLSPGIWNAEAGPDFLKAHLKIGSKEYRGDIEIHLIDESWTQHQHHVDERYDQLILHLSLWQPKTRKPIVTKNGRIITQAYLEHCLSVPQSRIIQLIDLDLYPYKKFLGSGRCAHELFRTLPESKITSFFQGAAEWRLEQKSAYLKERISEPAWQLAAGIAMALGYKNNTEAFLELFLKLHSLPQHNEEEYLALGMRSCGFFSDYFKQKWGKSEKYRHLQEVSMRSNVPFSHTTKLVLSQVRPLNHPVRRLAVMTKLLSSPTLPSLYSTMHKHWEQCWPICKSKKDWRAVEANLCALLPDFQDAYWNRHYTFEQEERKEFLTLIGEELRSEIVVNTFLPLLYQQVKQRGMQEEIHAFRELYNVIPAAKNSKTRYLVHRFFGDTPKGTILNKAYTEQGAYQLHRDFCLHYEASCEGCPFVDRFNTMIK